jgi:hypothetical protein
MNQTLNIFRKDLRLFWPEILSSLTVLVLFIGFERRSWTLNPSYGVVIYRQSPVAGFSAYAFAGLLCVSWAILIIRLIQAERLAGLYQFWTTRPYEWPKLLAAKALNLLLFLYCPLALAQILLLHLAGFDVAPHLPAVLLDIVLLTAYLILPLVCIAAVTSSFAQALLAMLATAVVFIVMASGVLTGKNLEPRSLTSLQVGVTIVVLSLAVLQQYRHRKTKTTLALYAATAALLFATQAFSPGSSFAVSEYPAPSQATPASIAFDPDPTRIFKKSSARNPDSQIVLRIPLLLSSADPGALFAIEGARVHLQSPDGYEWDSPWESDSGILGADKTAWAGGAFTLLAIPKRVYDRMSGGEVSARVEFAATQIRWTQPYASTLSAGYDKVPGLGLCGIDGFQPSLRCRSVFGPPPLFLVKTFRAAGTCMATPTPLVPATGQIGRTDFHETMMAVAISPISVTPGLLVDTTRGPQDLCPGTPITYTEMVLDRRLLLQSSPAKITLKNYAGSF